MSYRSRKVDEAKNPKEAETLCDNEELSENKERDESKEGSDEDSDEESGEEEDHVTETENGEDYASNEALLKQFHEEQLKAGHKVLFCLISVKRRQDHARLTFHHVNKLTA